MIAQGHKDHEKEKTIPADRVLKDLNDKIGRDLGG
jgi:hypothetical protein